uniref:Insulin-like domain-containing protein n=1 Tax=Globodera rostochiensis TaxID=31243 RepID=A0A914I848_GLORO
MPLLLFRMLFILPALLLVLRPSTDHSSSSSSSSSTRDRSTLVLCANALPISIQDGTAEQKSVLGERIENDGQAKDLSEQKTTEDFSNFGRLKLCPPGGRSFFEAFELACPMKRRRRKRHTMFGFGRAPTMAFGKEMAARYGNIGGSAGEADKGDGAVQQNWNVYRPANITEIMQICCSKGCEFADLLPHCGPFSLW